MIFFKETVNKATLYTSMECSVPSIGEHIMFNNNPKEYKIVGIIGVAGVSDKTVIVQPLSTSHISFKGYLNTNGRC